MALTRADIAERLIAKSNLPKNLAQDFVDAFFEDIASTLEKGEVVKLTGFGNFELKQKKARPGLNPLIFKITPPFLHKRRNPMVYHLYQD